MRRSLTLPLLVSVTLLLGCESIVSSDDGDGSAVYATGAALAAGDQATFGATLSGAAEHPSNDSQGRGVAKFKLSKDGTAITYKLNVANIENVTQSHIHCGSADVNGPVVAFLFGFVAGGVTVNGTLAEGTITAASVIPRPDTPECPGGVADYDELLAKMRSGEAYVNVHTVAIPAGEIRGQITHGSGVDQ